MAPKKRGRDSSKGEAGSSALLAKSGKGEAGSSARPRSRERDNSEQPEHEGGWSSREGGWWHNPHHPDIICSLHCDISPDQFQTARKAGALQYPGVIDNASDKSCLMQIISYMADSGFKLALRFKRPAPGVTICSRLGR